MYVCMYRSLAHERIGLSLEPLIQSGYISSLESSIKKLFEEKGIIK